MVQQNTKLTKAQRRLLKELPDDKWIFAKPNQDMSYFKLKSLGYAESDLAVAMRDNRRGYTELKAVFRRTPSGKAAASEMEVSDG